MVFSTTWAWSIVVVVPLIILLQYTGPRQNRIDTSGFASGTMLLIHSVCPASGSDNSQAARSLAHLNSFTSSMLMTWYVMLDLLKHRLLIWAVLERFKGFVIDWIDRLIVSAGLNIGLSVFTLLAWIAVKWYFGQSLFHSSRSASVLNDAACWAHFDETSPTTDKKTSTTIPIAVRELISIAHIHPVKIRVFLSAFYC